MDICKHNEACGGCSWQGTAYEDQLIAKDREVVELLEKEGLHPKETAPIAQSPDIYRYRNKMEYTFGDMEKGGPLCLGMHQKGRFMSVVTVDQCQLVPGDFNTVLAATLEFCRPYSKYHKKRHEGLLRNLIVRRGERRGELLINLVTTSLEGFDQQAYVQMVLALPLSNKVVGILRTINDRVSDAVCCDELRILYGRDFYLEETMGMEFKVGAFSFFQANVKAAERLYLDALTLIPGLEGKVVHDLFCGTGTITQALAKKAAKVIGVEISAEAVSAARQNAAANGMENCEFHQGDVLEVLSGQLLDSPDVIVVDPPRPGISPKAIARIMEAGPGEILYISCNPKTMVRDLGLFCGGGYELSYVRAYDNFPFTKHTESVALLKK